MTRVLVTFNHPQHLSDAEAEAWIHSELRGLRSLPGVVSVVLTRAGSAARQPRPWDWACELHLASEGDGRASAEHPLCEEWLLDLRLLGMRPALAVLGTGEEIE